ncbi:MAG: tripartite tricarboxylate transporter substrate binding protein [Pigmentiphaga sp.]|uniref:Bug family tripartite tricarboxylate transporter substrate binding protein n=1 Tax=Pigmentiphaga sp. TaxID=1977564 RepID=UPI0029B2E6FB|nr:tripartite tricarboxylate transporter substrate binding protein [Pigmentiphaga sp.]MDX3907289.1 tripartite tricarboxylate transporter substrate binding protein [Pigmentiphaga sp.]
MIAITRALAFSLLLLPIGAPQAQPQTYPSKPIKIVAPYPAGGYFDTMARALGNRMGQLLGQVFVVENRAGANGLIGAQAVATAAPDGYTLLLGGIGPNGTNVALYDKLPYNPERDFAPIVHITNSPCILVVNPDLPVKNVGELLAMIRREPGKLSYASASVGSSQHLFAELFLAETGTRMTHIPYKGSNPSVVAVLSGEVPVSFGIAADVIEHVKSGRLRALATTGARRIAQLPDVPTMAEAGVPNLVANAWFGLYAPAGTPESVIDLLHEKARIALQDQDVRDRVSANGAAEVVAGSPQELRALQAGEIARWTRLVKQAKLTAE